MKTQSLTPPVAFPVPDFAAVDAVFGARGKDYLTREQLGDWYDLSCRTPFHECASKLFFKGGKLEDYGLRLKPEIDKAKAMTALRALLSSFDPKHEIKIGTCAVALANWCDVIDKADAA